MTSMFNNALMTHLLDHTTVEADLAKSWEISVKRASCNHQDADSDRVTPALFLPPFDPRTPA